MPGGVVFRADEEHYFVPAAIAKKLLPVPELTRVPGGPPELLGIALVETEILPIVSVGHAQKTLLVCEHLGERLGLVGIEVLATGTFPGAGDGDGDGDGDEIDYEGRRVRAYDVGAAIGRVRASRWVV